VDVRPKLSGAPLGYTFWKTGGIGDDYTAFAKALWSDDRAVDAALKELVFLRCSIVNACPT